jgi:aryl-alcohol dehydrogenase-like predicted oxidoreductase
MTIEHTLKSRQIGSTGLTVFPLALGCMRMSGIYGSTNDDKALPRSMRRARSHIIEYR